MPQEIYLDANATTPVLPAAADAVQRAMRTLYGNPSSTHYVGIQARDMLATTRSRAARLLGTGDGKLLFVSGATEAIQTAVLSALCAVRARLQGAQAVGTLLLYGATEHKAVPESLAHWNRLLGLKLELRALPVDSDGQHDLAMLRELAPHAALVCTMAANNETGVVSDLPAIEAVLHEMAPQALWLVDCVQALGKLALNLSGTRIDYAAFSGHKLYAPKGIGMLYVRTGAPFTPLMAGGGQEGGQRSGTENMAGVAALGAVLDALEDGHTFRSHEQLVTFRDQMAQSLREALPGIVFNTPFAKALPTTLNFSVPGFSSKELLDLFDAAGIRVSSGSACSAAKAAPSYVLEAMGLPAWRTGSAIRMSFGPATDAAFIALACERIAACGEALRAGRLLQSGLQPHTADGVVQFTVDGASTWLVLDAASRSCVVINTQAELALRLQSTVDGLGYRLVAELGTSAVMDTRRAVLSPAGWPAEGPAVTLADGTVVEALRLGSQVLARLLRPHGHVYLLGTPQAGLLAVDAVRFAFFESATPALLLEVAHVAHAATVLCAASGAQGLVATSLDGAQSQVDVSASDGMHLDAAAVEVFLRAHADAVLVDVREPFEHAAGPLRSWPGREAIQVPMSRLADRLGALLGETPRPLVFVCRSGNRSGKAAACLRNAGHPQAWSLQGGLALSR